MGEIEWSESSGCRGEVSRPRVAESEGRTFKDSKLLRVVRETRESESLFSTEDVGVEILWSIKSKIGESMDR